MNLMSLEVEVKKIRINLESQCCLAFSIRLGTVLSQIVNFVPKSGKHNVMEPNLRILLTCEESKINANTRACLVIYAVNDDGEKNIIGMVFILLKNKESAITKYKIQQSNDSQAFVQLVHSISSLEIHHSRQQQILSQISHSSYAEVHEFQKFLEKGINQSEKQSSEDDFQPRMKKNKNQKDSRSIASSNLHMKSEQPQSYIVSEGGIDPSYAILLKKAENQLEKQKQKINSLVNIIAIEEDKSRESQIFIIKLLQKIKQISTKNLTNNHNLFEDKSNQDDEEEKKSEIMKKRDELYEISQDLYRKNKSLKTENDELRRSIRHQEHQLEYSHQENEELKNQNIEIKKKLFQFCDREQEKNQDVKRIQVLQEKIMLLQKQNAQKQRKIKQIFNGIQEFRNDAYRANQELIVKQGEIQRLQEQLEQIKNKFQKQYSKLASNNIQDNKYLFEEKDKIQDILHILQNTSKTRLIQFQKLYALESLKTSYQQQSFLNKDQILMIVQKRLKHQIGILCHEMRKEKNQKISLLEMRRKFIILINQISPEWFEEEYM